MNNAIKEEIEAEREYFLYLMIGEVCCHETETERQYQQGKAFAEHNKAVFDVAMAVSKFYNDQLDLRMDAYARERKALAEIEKLKQELSRCRAMNADYLTAKTDAENRAKLLEKEVADLKVPESRQNRHLRDELHKVRLECQQAWKCANQEMEENKELSNHIFVLDGKLEKLELDNHSLDQVAKVFQSDLAKKDAEIKELRERNEALKRQLDESNRQIEIYAKKVRNLEAELEEDGGLG